MTAPPYALALTYLVNKNHKCCNYTAKIYHWPALLEKGLGLPTHLFPWSADRCREEAVAALRDSEASQCDLNLIVWTYIY